MGSERARQQRVRDFVARARYAPSHVFTTSDLGSYIAVHPMADEAELLGTLGVRPSDCMKVDAYWKHEHDVYFVEVSTEQGDGRRDVGLWSRLDRRGPQRMHLVAVTETKLITRQTFHDALRAFVRCGSERYSRGPKLRRLVQEGIVMDAVIVASQPYGLDIAIDGHAGFVQPTEISWTDERARPQDFTVGERLKVFVYAITKKKIFASIKQASPEANPWRDPSVFAVGTRHEGTVRSVRDWGTTVELQPGVFGMILTKDGPPNVEAGERLHVEVIALELPLKKIGLKFVGSDEGQRA